MKLLKLHKIVFCVSIGKILLFFQRFSFVFCTTNDMKHTFWLKKTENFLK